MSKRCIQKYLCFKCNTWQEQQFVHSYKEIQDRIESLFCHTCNQSISVSSTSLFSGEKYVLKYLRYPSIIDNDHYAPIIVFEGINIVALNHVCHNFNLINNYTYSQACHDYIKYINES